MHRLTWLTGHLWKVSTGVWGHSLPPPRVAQPGLWISLGVLGWRGSPCYASQQFGIFWEATAWTTSQIAFVGTLLKTCLMSSGLSLKRFLPRGCMCLWSPFVLFVCRLMFLLSIAVLHCWIINSAVNFFFLLTVHWLSCLIYPRVQFETGAWEFWLILTGHMYDLSGG